MSTIDRDRLTEPLRTTSQAYYVAFALAATVSLATGVAYFLQLRHGFAVTGLGDWGTARGVPWGLYIGTFVWWIGIAHGGIAISAAVRLFDLETYMPIARIAEVITLIALPMAATNILFDLGRPDHLWAMITNWGATMHTSPLTWDMTTTFLYFVMAGTYLAITIRDDVRYCLDKGMLPEKLTPLYNLLLWGYEEGETVKTRQMAWWLALGILLLVPLMSGGVVPWLFATMGMHEGWFGAATGPAMLAESLTSALAAVVVTAAVFRYAYGWDDIIDDSVFKGLNKALIAFILLTIWFLLQDIVTGLHPVAPTATSDLTSSLVYGSMAAPFWLSMTGLAIGLVYFSMQALKPSLFSVRASAVAALLVSLAILQKKTVFVVEGLIYPTQEPLSSMFPTGSYFPTLPEFTMALGTIGVAALLFLVATKVMPIVELQEHAGDVDVGDVAEAEEVTEA